MSTNSYSARWFEYFHSSIPQERTRQEVAFIQAQAPLSEFRVIADMCCGMGRHARALAALGYEVTGVERDAEAVKVARRMGGGPRYLCADVRESVLEERAYDAITVMSQSFGYFDDTANLGVLASFSDALRDGGRVVLDVWNPQFFARHQGARTLTLQQATIVETKQMRANRLLVRLDYPDGSADRFDWQLFTPEEMAELARLAGLDLIGCFTDFNGAAPGEGSPKIQFVLSKATRSARTA